MITTSGRLGVSVEDEIVCLIVENWRHSCVEYTILIYRLIINHLMYYTTLCKDCCKRILYLEDVTLVKTPSHYNTHT